MEVINLTKVYGGGTFNRQETVALEGFNLTIPGSPACITTLAGESGSGKTTLANLILGFLSPSSGQVLFKGKNIWDMSKAEWFSFRRQVQAVFQDPFGTFNPFYRVDNVFETAITNFRLSENRAEARRMTEEALEVVGLRSDEILGRYPHQLSGGQRQRIMVARAFLLKPRLIVADEPVSMIDASLQVRILNILVNLREEYGISFLYITHDLATAYQISDDIHVLYLGSLMERGDIDTIIRSPQHPYSQLLVKSIPIPDSKVRWQGKVRSSAAREGESHVIGGCKYYGRCPHRMDICTQAIPPLYEVEPSHYVSCYLHQDKPHDRDL